MGELNFNFASVANGYGQVTGLLAGFSFAAVGVLLVKPNIENSSESQTNRTEILSTAILALLVTFGVFMLSSFTYGGVSGPTSKLSAAMLFFIGCSLFAVGVATMFTAICWLFVSYRLSKPVLAFARLLAMGAVLVAVFNELYAGNLLVHLLAEKMELEFDSFETIAIIVVLIVVAIFLMGSASNKGENSNFVRARRFRVMMFIVLLGAIVAGAFVALIAGWQRHVSVDGLLPAGVFFIGIGFTMMIAILCSIALPASTLVNDIKDALSK